MFILFLTFIDIYENINIDLNELLINCYYETKNACAVRGVKGLATDKWC